MKKIKELKNHVEAIRSELKYILSDDWNIQQYDRIVNDYNQSIVKLKVEKDFSDLVDLWESQINNFEREVKTESGILPSWFIEQILATKETTLTEQKVMDMLRVNNTLSDKNFTLIKSTLNQSLQYFRLKHKQHLMKWFIQIISVLDYPPNFMLWNELSDNDKTEYKNKFRKEREKEGRENEPKRERVYSEARKIIGDKPVSNFFAPKGWPKSNLYTLIVRRTGYSKGNVRYWLKKAYEAKNKALFKKK